MAYTTIDKPSDYFNTKLYTGTGSSNAITGVGFQPDWVWIKSRSDALSHATFDSVRGVTKVLVMNADTAEYTNTDTLTAFGTDGFTVGSNTGVNTDTKTRVAWNWKAGTSFTNDASSTSIGSIDSAGSVSDVSGFSIVSYTGTGSNGTIKHGLSTAPDLFIIRRLDDDNDWRVGSSALTNFVKHINLNTTAAEDNLAAAFNSTGPTTSVFSVGTSISVNASGGTYIAYCFSSIKGYSKIGSYAANENVNGTFVYTGFKPAFVIQKQINLARDWHMFDNKRSTSNAVGKYLSPNDAGAEDSGEDYLDLLSNGFKIKNTGANFNDASGTYIFVAFAENPFVTSTGVPGTAR